jgi:hypothetical protein
LRSHSKSHKIPEMALNLHDELVGYRGEQVEGVWAVQGRGKVK